MLEKLIDDLTPTNLEKESLKKKFFKLMSLNGFDFSDIDDASKLPKVLIPVINNDTEPFNKFNIVLAKLNKEKEISILDVMAIIVNDYLDPVIALKCLDELNYITLSNELKGKYKVKMDNVDEEQEESLMEFFD